MSQRDGWEKPGRIVRGARTRIRKAVDMDTSLNARESQTHLVGDLGTIMDLQPRTSGCGVTVSLCNADADTL